MQDAQQPTELYKRFRPRTLGEVRGQTIITDQLEKMLTAKRLPHSLMFTGGSGVGKTTVARILARRLECSKIDFHELNCSETRGIDDIRAIGNRMSGACLGGKSRIWLIDEAHGITRDAQQALLKMIEDTPSHVYFFICTTEPAKLLKTIHTRCTEFKFKELDSSMMLVLLKEIVIKAKLSIREVVLKAIVEAAEGSARSALVILDQIQGITNEKEQFAGVAAADYKTVAIDVARMLMKPNASWAEISKVIKPCTEDPESVRRCVLGYASAILRNGKADARAAEIIEAFWENWFDVGAAGLTLSCWNLCAKR